MNTYKNIGDKRVNEDGSVSTLVDNGDGSIGTFTTNCPMLPPLYLYSDGVIRGAAVKEEQEVYP